MRHFQKAIYGYKRRRDQSGFSPFVLLFGHPPRITPIENGALCNSSGEYARISKNLAASSIQATRAVRKSRSVDSKEPRSFGTSEKVLLSEGPAIQQNVKWPAF